MNVLHINCNYMTTVLHQTMIEHLDTFVNNTVVCPFQIGREGVIKPNDNVRVLKCFNKYDRLFYFIKQKKILKAVEKEINIEDNNLVHAYTLMTDGNVAYCINNKYGIPYVVAIRDTDLYVFFKKKPYLIKRGIKIMENASVIFFLSNPHKQEMLERYIPKNMKSTLENKMYVVSNGIDDFWLDNKYFERDYASIEKKIENKTLNVICVGRINKRKNITTVQKAINILNKQGWKIQLDVIGGVEDQAELDIILHDRYTTYHPAMDKTALIDYYRKADIFILASHKETFGLVYAEAMSQSLPVIYTKGQGFDGQFKQGEVGYSVNDTKPEEIVSGIVKISDRYRDISKKALNMVDRYRWSTICGKYRMIYEEKIMNSILFKADNRVEE